MPYIYSRDSRGNERNFLADYYRTTRELASNVFRKGYQWPFHATRMLDFGSSLLDLAVFRETQAGRKVFMDFNRNPLAAPGEEEFSLDRLDDDVRAYLEKSGALLEMPLDRLRQMNPLSIELYKRYKYDITRDPLEFAINNQHMNGGLAVDTWGETSLCGCYAVGEAAGTHGVTRPGGAALNAGQVFGARCAEHIAARRGPGSDARTDLALVSEAVGRVLDVLNIDSVLTVGAIGKDVQARMSDHAGILCNAKDVRSALDAARALNESIRRQGVAYDGRLRSLARAAVAADRAPLRSRPHGARVLCRARRRQPRRPGPLRSRRGSHAYGSHRSSRELPVCFRATRRPRPADTRSPEGGDFHLCYAAGATSRSRLPAVLRARLARLPDRRDPQSR